LLGEGELGDSGCAGFLSEPLFDRLPCVLETGEEGAPSAGDVAKAFRLRKRGVAQRKKDGAQRKRSGAQRKRSGAQRKRSEAQRKRSARGKK
jgi:hypothetical protein